MLKDCLWRTNDIPDDWKEGYLTKLPKRRREDLKECKNWSDITLLSTAGKGLNRINLERIERRAGQTTAGRTYCRVPVGKEVYKSKAVL